MSETSHNPSKVRRRNRVINSCLECRRRKLKCSRTQPCASCAKFSRKCVFLEPSALDPVGLTKLAEIKEKVGDLEHLLEDEVALRATRSHSPTDRPIKVEEEAETEAIPPRLTIREAAYEDDADGELADLGIRFGKMRVTERIGGLVRPHLVQELDQLISSKDGHPSSFYPVPVSVPAVSGPPVTETFTIPSSSLGLGTLTLQSFHLGAFIPSKAEADILYLQYYAAVDPLAHVLHRPSFDQQYSKFWLDIYRGIPPPKAITCLVFSVFFAAATSLPDTTTQEQFGLQKQALVDKFHHAAEQALVQAKFMKATSIEILQAVTVYLIPQCRAEISRSHSALVGALIRLAQGAGLHHDNDGYAFSPLETQIRRLLWFHICLLDLITAEVQGPQPTIRDDDYDTRFPLNVDDHCFTSSNREPEPSPGWTCVTLTLMRFECNEIKRFIFQERRRIDKGLSTFSVSKAKSDEMTHHVVEKYTPMLDESIPLQRHALNLLRLSKGKIDAMMMQRHLAVTMENDEREQLREVVIRSCFAVVENGMKLDTDPELEPWRWFTGSYHQYHSAIFLLTIAYQLPAHPMIDRIWTVLDHVFDTDFIVPLDREERARCILLMLNEKLDSFLKSRKVRVPLPPRQLSGRNVSKSLNQLIGSHQPIPQHPYTFQREESSSSSPGSSDIGSEAIRKQTLAPGADVSMGNWYLSDYQLSTENSLSIDWDEWDTLMRTGPPNQPNRM